MTLALFLIGPLPSGIVTVLPFFKFESVAELALNPLGPLNLTVILVR